MTELMNLRKVSMDDRHNAFTDLIRWRDHYYLTYRNADHHGSTPPGNVELLRSADLIGWEHVKTFDTGGDDRDPKFVTFQEQLYVTFGTWYPRWGDRARSIPNEPEDMVTHVSSSSDGVTWSVPHQVYGVNYWLWRMLPMDGSCYCAAYHFGRRSDRDMRTVHLLHSEDLLDWRLVCHMREGGGPGEPVLYSPEPGTMHCIIRTLEPRRHSWIGKSAAPYTEWKWKDLGVMIHAPVMLNVEDRWLCAGRAQPEDLPDDSFEHDSNHYTALWEICDDRPEHMLTLPSAGDCSYAGMSTTPDGSIALSYYSQHQRIPLPAVPPMPSDVFLAEIKL